MGASARSKVDQQLLICRELLSLLSSVKESFALLSSFCLQWERGICFYLQEVQLSAGRKPAHLRWTLDREYLVETALASQLTDLTELADLAQNEESWLSHLLMFLEVARETNPKGSLSAEIFLSDLATSSSPQVIASSRNNDVPLLDLAGAENGLEQFQALVSRQRSGHEEY